MNTLPPSDSTTITSSTNASVCWKILRFCHTFAIAILAGCVIFLFLQVQYLAFEVNAQHQQVLELETQLRNTTQHQIAALTDKVDAEHSLTLYQMAGTFTLLTCLLTMFHMTSHLRNYHEPIVQRKILAILWMSPIYAVTSFLSLVVPSADGYLAVIKDFYEAYAIYSFLAFLIAVLGRGDRSAAVDVLALHAHHLKAPMRLLNGCYHPPPDSSAHAKANAVLTECQILAMQFVFIRPLTSIASFASTLIRMEDGADANHTDNSAATYFTSPAFFCAMITNISVFLAFTGLLKFYHAVRDDLQWCQPFSKFMTIKSIVFLTFWQGLLISIVVSIQAEEQGGGASHTAPPTRFLQQAMDSAASGNGTSFFGSGSSSFPNSVQPNNQSTSSSSSSSSYSSPDEQAAQIQNFLICLEMLFFSIAHWCVFPVEEWEPDYRPRQYDKPGMGVKDFVKDLSQIISSRSEARAYRKQATALGSSVAGRAVAGEDELEEPEMQDLEDAAEGGVVASDTLYGSAGVVMVHHRRTPNSLQRQQLQEIVGAGFVSHEEGRGEDGDVVTVVDGRVARQANEPLSLREIQ